MSPEKKTGPWKWWQLVLLALFILAGFSAALYFLGPRALAPAPEAAEVVAYDADYASTVCGERPVDSFDPTTGKVECARWDPEQLVAAKEEAEPTEAVVTEVEVEKAVEAEAPAELPREGELFQTPVEATDVFNDESSWLIAEPGVLLDASTAWTIPSTEARHFANVPEGGFWYASLGEGMILVDDVELSLPGENGLNYLVLIRGRIDDGIVDSDLNLTAEVTDFVPGHAIWSHMPPGAYVSKDWFHQQLVASSTSGFTNCGATGCSRVHVVLFDVDSHFFQKFEVQAGALDDWELLGGD